MRYMGIDYGTKRVGIAVSDDEGHMAFPKMVVPNDKNMLQSVETFIKDEKIGEVVIGESFDQYGKENPIMKEIKNFVGQLSITTMLPIHFERESFSSIEAGKQHQKKPTAREPKQKMTKNDASAAALILQRFLDKQK